MSMRPSIYEWYGRHPDLLDGLTTQEVAWLLGENVEPPDDQKDWRVVIVEEQKHDQPSAGRDDDFEADQNASKRLKKFSRTVNLGGISVRMQRRIATGVEQTYKEYPKLGSVAGFYITSLDEGVQAERKPGGRIAFSRFEMESVGFFDRRNQAGKDAETYWREAKAKLGPGAAKDRLVKLVERTERYGPPNFSRSSVEGVVMHELGHHAAARLLANKDFRAAQAAWHLADKLEGGAYSVSVYGESSFQEHVAESFAMSRIAPALVEASTGGRSLLKAFATLR